MNKDMSYTNQNILNFTRYITEEELNRIMGKTVPENENITSDSSDESEFKIIKYKNKNRKVRSITEKLQKKEKSKIRRKRKKQEIRRQMALKMKKCKEKNKPMKRISLIYEYKKQEHRLKTEERKYLTVVEKDYFRHIKEMRSRRMKKNKIKNQIYLDCKNTFVYKKVVVTMISDDLNTETFVEPDYVYDNIRWAYKRKKRRQEQRERQYKKNLTTMILPRSVRASNESEAKIMVKDIMLSSIKTKSEIEFGGQYNILG